MQQTQLVLPVILSTGVASYREPGITRDRKVTYFEIELPLENKGVSHIGHHHSPVRTDTLICAKPGQVRHTEFPFRCYFIHLELTGGILYDKMMETPDFIRTEHHTRYRSILEKISYYRYAAIDTKELILQSLVLEFLFDLLLDCRIADNTYPGRSFHNDTVVEALKYIENHLDADLSLETMSERYGLSAVHFHNCFKKYTGSTLREHVENQRIAKAIDMMTQTDCTLAQIAYDCGFSSQSYFNYAFRRKTGHTPREYIRALL